MLLKSWKIPCTLRLKKVDQTKLSAKFCCYIALYFATYILILEIVKISSVWSKGTQRSFYLMVT